jgi:probable HAF family extracellular repeat protein
MADLGDLSGGSGNTRAYAINSLGQIVGASVVASPLHHAFLWQDGVMTDLGVLSDTDSSLAEGINDSGVVVGSSYEDGGILTSHRLFIWDSINGMRDANNLLDSSSAGWTLYGCRDINNLGQIAGWGTNPDGQIRGLLLTPVPEPSTLIIWSLLGGLAIAVGLRRRKRTG